LVVDDLTLWDGSRSTVNMIYSIVPQQGPLFLSREAEFGKIEPILIPLFKMQYGSIGWFNTLMMQSFQVTSLPD